MITGELKKHEIKITRSRFRAVSFRRRPSSGPLAGRVRELRGAGELMRLSKEEAKNMAKKGRAKLAIEKQVDGILEFLRNKIREKDFTQREVQERNGWGETYISQLLTGQKRLRVAQLLMILAAIGVEPEEFYAELYQFHWLGVEPPVAASEFLQDQAMVYELVQLLVKKGIFSENEVIAAIGKRE